MIKQVQASSAILVFQQLGLAVIAGAMGIISQATMAATMGPNESTTIPVDLAGINTTKHEIAVMQVLSEICPPMLNSQQRQKFYKTYNIELQKLLPTIDDPKAAMQYLSTQQDYKNVLKGIRTWTMGISKEENKALCQELAEASF